MVWKILLGILLLIVLLLLIPLRLSVRLRDDGDVTLRFFVLGIPVFRVPERKKPVRLSDYSPRALEKRRAKERRAEEKKQRKKQKAAAKKARKPVPPDKEAGIGEKLRFISDIASAVAERSLRRARVDFEELEIVIGTDDAAKTALLTGAATSAVTFLLEILHQFTRLRIRRDCDCTVRPDFTSERCRYRVLLHFRMHVWHVLDIAIHTLVAFLKNLLKKTNPTAKKS